MKTPEWQIFRRNSLVLRNVYSGENFKELKLSPCMPWRHMG